MHLKKPANIETKTNQAKLVNIIILTNTHNSNKHAQRDL